MFVLNCLTYLADTLAPHACGARKREALHVQVEARVHGLINEHVRPPSMFTLFPFALLT